MLRQRLNPIYNTLAHEIGCHILVDHPRSKNGGDEHKGTVSRQRVCHKDASSKRRQFTTEECSAIFGNIGKYNGTCM